MGLPILTSDLVSPTPGDRPGLVVGVSGLPHVRRGRGGSDPDIAGRHGLLARSAAARSHVYFLHTW